MPDKRETSYKAMMLKKDIKEFHEYLINRLVSRNIVRNELLYDEYARLIVAYENHFKINDI